MQQALDQISALYADNWPFLLAVSIAGSTGATQTSYLTDFRALGAEITSALAGAGFDGVNLWTGATATNLIKDVSGGTTAIGFTVAGGMAADTAITTITNHAIAAGAVAADAVMPELGQVIAGQVDGRRSADDVTICDLTGTGAQDTAIAQLAFGRAAGSGRGTRFES